MDAFVGEWRYVSALTFFSDEDTMEATELRKTCLDRAKHALLGLPVSDAASGDLSIHIK